MISEKNLLNYFYFASIKYELKSATFLYNSTQTNPIPHNKPNHVSSIQTQSVWFNALSL